MCLVHVMQWSSIKRWVSCSSVQELTQWKLWNDKVTLQLKRHLISIPTQHLLEFRFWKLRLGGGGGLGGDFVDFHISSSINVRSKLRE
jgi:hypothetical protein